MDYTNQVKKLVLGLGADLVGIADVKSLKGLKTIPPNLLDPFNTVLSIAMQLPAAIFKQIVDQPTPNYASAYLTANRLLDEIAFKISNKMESDGYQSLPIPASQALDKENWYAAISHKAVAFAAGIGWQGKNLLLITPEYGSRVRLVSVLTTALLNPDNPVANRCGKCMACRDACPVNAIKGINTQTHYENRNQALFFDRCKDKLTKEFAQLPDIGAPMCGLCIKACPFTRKSKKDKIIES
ncbi:MAG: 4Fe-4S double cluster binding domain-containing protein [Pseudomonadota bacterium]